MVFAPAETAPTLDETPSAPLADGLRHTERGECREAAVLLSRVVEGETSDAPTNVQKAQFFLGTCLVRLGFRQSALAVFDEITQQGQSHTFFVASLPWIGRLALALPEPAGVSNLVGRYTRAHIDALAGSPAIHDALLYAYARRRYDEGALDEAARSFAGVPERSALHVPSKFFEGVTWVRLRRAQPARRAFRSVLGALERGDTPVEDDDRMRDLAWLSLARLDYSAANRSDGRTDPRLLQRALDSWLRVPTGSEHWLDAMFEESWALFLAHEEERALGHAHAIESPFFDDQFYPEAAVIRAVILFRNCNLDEAQLAIRRFHERYDPIQRGLATVMQRASDEERAFALLRDVRASRSGLDARVAPVVRSALSDREVGRHLVYLRVLATEERRLNEMDAGFRGTSVAGRIGQDLALARSFAIAQAGALVRERLGRISEELRDRMNEMDTVELEITTFRRVHDIRPGRARRPEIWAHQGDQLWRFDGEYWEDELPYYRQRVQNRCGR